MEEIYKDIEGYEGLYQVSNIGNVKSLNYNKTKKENVLKPAIRNGYLKVDLCKNKTRKTYSVHRLVAQAFIENPNNYPMINHKDESRTNNVFTNLEWCDNKYNSNYGSRNERLGKAISKALTNNQKHSKAVSKALKNNPNISKSVGAYKDGNLVMTFPSTAEARRQGYNEGAVAACCRNCFNRLGNNVYKGYTWKYNPIE